MTRIEQKIPISENEHLVEKTVRRRRMPSGEADQVAVGRSGLHQLQRREEQAQVQDGAQPQHEEGQVQEEGRAGPHLIGSG